MNPIRFESNQREFAAALYENINAYFLNNGIGRKGNWHSRLKTILMLGLYLGPFILILAVPLPGWILSLLVILMGVGMAGSGMSVMHDACHGALSSRPWINRLFSQSVYIFGSNRLNWHIQHNYLHHNFTNIFGADEDIGGRLVLRFSSKVPCKKMHRYQHHYAFFLYCLLSISKLVKDFFQLKRYGQSDLNQKIELPKEMAILCATKLIYFFVVIGLPLMLTEISFGQIIFGFFAVHCIGSFIMALVFQLAHVVEIVEKSEPNSDGVVERDWAIHQLKTTANFSPNNRWLTWFVGGLNYQIEHHLFPAVCHIHYPKLAPIVASTAKEFGFAYHVFPTLFGAISSHRRVLQSLGKP